jgi:integrase
LDPLRRHQLRTTIVAVRSLFRFAKKRGLVFANPAARLKAADPGGSLLPMTDAEIRAVEQAATSPAQRLIVVLAAVHAARWAAIRDLTLDDLDLPNRRITIAGHPQRLGELTHRALQAWLGHRRATWPHTPNRHVLISVKTALGTGPVSRGYLNWNLQRHGVSIERIRRDRVLHEALTARADPPHLAWYSACPRPPPASTPSSPAISSPARRPALTRNSAMLPLLCSAGGGAVQAGGQEAAACYGRTLRA